jgi:hypothetical protein
MWVEGLGIEDVRRGMVRFMCGFEQGEKKDTIIHRRDAETQRGKQEEGTRLAAKEHIEHRAGKGSWPWIRTDVTRMQTERREFREFHELWATLWELARGLK